MFFTYLIKSHLLRRLTKACRPSSESPRPTDRDKPIKKALKFDFGAQREKMRFLAVKRHFAHVGIFLAIFLACPLEIPSSGLCTPSSGWSDPLNVIIGHSGSTGGHRQRCGHDQKSTVGHFSGKCMDFFGLGSHQAATNITILPRLCSTTVCPYSLR